MAKFIVRQSKEHGGISFPEALSGTLVTARREPLVHFFSNQEDDFFNFFPFGPVKETNPFGFETDGKLHVNKMFDFTGQIDFPFM